MSRSVLVVALALAAAVAVSAVDSHTTSSVLDVSSSSQRWDQATFKEVHPAIAMLAERMLTPRARAAAKALVPDFRAEAGWADRITFTEPRQLWSSAMHFINLPSACAPAPGVYNRARDCKDKAGTANVCVDGAIQNYTARLADVRLPQEQRAEALKFLIHFIGDIHQPLHVANADDWGGNKLVGALMTDAATNLHAIWDAGIAARRVTTDFGGDATRWANSLMGRVKSHDRKQWTKCRSRGYRYGQCSDEWALESAELACNYAYKLADGKTPVPAAGFVLDEAYYRRAINIVERCVAKAAVRLANVINLVLGAAPAPVNRGPVPRVPPRPPKVINPRVQAPRVQIPRRK